MNLEKQRLRQMWTIASPKYQYIRIWGTGIFVEITQVGKKFSVKHYASYVARFDTIEQAKDWAENKLLESLRLVLKFTELLQ